MQLLIMSFFKPRFFSSPWFQVFLLYSVLIHPKYVRVLRFRNDVDADFVLHWVVGAYVSRKHNILLLKGRNILQ
jgi:hypothetical protein